MSTPPNREVVLFSAALELDAGQRGAYLDQACADDPALRLRLEALLRVHEEAIPFLETLAPGTPGFPVGAEAPGARVSPPSSPAEKAGDRIGRYKLLQQIGEGGCGVVYMAEQEEPVRRRVALKVIKLGMDTRQVVARFEAERQALALMDHPNIAKVFDAGATDTGRPYFVMELVRGIPITRFCDENLLGTEQRQRLFVQVCQAVQHAHQKGIIHRDIKPSNILVADHDGVPVPKIIDFGIAKATTDQRLTDKTLFTAFEQFIGTPAYMSPEQAQLSGLDIDTRSDIYSLGVLLYELLTGSTPFDSKALMRAGLDEIRRTIREQEPERPSTRLSTMVAADLTEVAKQRHVEPAKLSSLIRDDLDWIVMKALEKDRARRYDTANGLAADVLRHLNCEPVIARPPSRLYEFQKTVRRHKFGFAAAVALIAALAVGALVSTLEAFHAKTEAAKATAISDFLQQLLNSANPDALKGAEYTVRQLLDDFSAGLGNQLAGQPVVEATVRATIGRAYYRLGAADKAQPQLERALTLRRRVFGNQAEPVAESLVDYAWTFFEQRQYAKGEPCVREALAIYRKHGTGGQPLISALWALQWLAGQQGQMAEMDAITEEALTIASKSPGVEFPEMASMLHGLADAKNHQSKYAEAESLALKAVGMHRRLQGTEHPETAWALLSLGIALRNQQKMAEAEAALREALRIFRKYYSPGHKSVDGTMNELKLVRRATGDSVAIEARARVYFFACHGQWKEALADATRLVDLEPGEHWNYHLLAPLQAQVGDLDGYRETCRRAVAQFRETKDPDIAERMAKDCLILPDAGTDLFVAGAWAATAVSRGKDTAAVPWIQFAQSLAEYRQGRFASAVDWAQKTLSHAGSVFERDVEAYMVLAMAQHGAGHAEEAGATLAKGVEIAEQRLPKLDGGNLDIWHDWIIAHILMREAKALLEGQTDLISNQTKGK